MKKLTDFELAAVGSGAAVVADLHWLAADIIHAGRYDHIITAAGLLASLGYVVWSIYRHRQTGSKPVQSVDDIDYRVKLSILKYNFKKYESKEQAIQCKTKAKARR